MRWSKAALAAWTTCAARTTAFGLPRSTSSCRVPFPINSKLSLETNRMWKNVCTAVRGGAESMPSATTTMMMSSSSSTSATVDSATTLAKTPTEYFRKDYTPLNYSVTSVDMTVHIASPVTTVTTQLHLQLPSSGGSSSIALDGDAKAVQLVSVQWRSSTNDDDDDTTAQVLSADVDYTVTPNQLIVHTLPDEEDAILQITVNITPETNTALSGLYKSSGMYCTQCEAMGFRRITYYPDRPDVMAVFRKVRIETVTTSADGEATTTPILLSNGNLIEQGTTTSDDDDKTTTHFAVWSDPFPKPSYLFALVASSTLGVLEDTFTTRSGREVILRLYAAPSHVSQLSYAMESLKRSMKWDEERFGLEYDLDLYNVVAVEDFNMGAMENKSLNVFNTAYVLADTATATDTDFQRVEAVIGHEYFHNWTGNRVTCRDWFQLTLKEGLTVFRDQEFSADMMQSAAVKRIEDVRGLRARQFPEDAGPLAHPIRPESYISMDNFYTATVYVKGAEIVRMYQTLLGRDGFRKGMDLYFERHDGSAVTCDDFLAAMGDANGVDLGQFRRWYSTPGTPIVEYSHVYNPDEGRFALTLTQQSQSTEGPLHIPVSVGLLDRATGKEVVPTKVLELKKETETFEFDGLAGDVVVSLLRTFSAPVKLISKYANDKDDGEESMAFLAAYDTDGFNRWEAGQKLYTELIFQAMADGAMSEVTLSRVEEAFRETLESNSAEHSLLAYTLTLPSESTLAEEGLLDIIDPIAIHKARGAVKTALARKFRDKIQSRYDAMTSLMENETKLKVDAASVGRRRLRNVLLEYLCCIRDTEEEQIIAADLAKKHYDSATGMTDKMAAFTCLASMDGLGAEARDEVTTNFYEQAEGDALVLNKWFTVQATADLPDVLSRVKVLKEHPEFTLRNPNRCRSLIGAFSTGNPAAFHDEQGESYKFLSGVLAEVDQLNPQLSSRLAGGLIQWRKYSKERGMKMKTELEKLSKLKLSNDLYEIVTKGMK